MGECLFPPLAPRCSGILLPVASLPGPYGMGELGPSAVRWLEFLADCGQRVWQILPLTPPGQGNSPYQSPSAMACNPALISLELLRDDGLLRDAELEPLRRESVEFIHYGHVVPLRLELLRRASERFIKNGGPAEWAHFCQWESKWLDDYALFSLIGEHFPGVEWANWPDALRRREGAAMGSILREARDELDTHRVQQYFFWRQWNSLRAKAKALGIRILGDIPIFVSHNSADVWAHPELFDLLPNGQPRTVAGVPPDYFSSIGQRWGNPLYRWDVHRENRYAWWVERLRRAMELYDAVRIDHFRGFVDFWEIPGDEPTAIAGRWVRGPALDFFQSLGEQLGEIPLIAEDLGILSGEVGELRDRLGIPGLRILLFALDAYDESSPFLPQNFCENCVAYTGTHDNDTLRSALFGSSAAGGPPASVHRETLRRILKKWSGQYCLEDAAMAALTESRASWVIFPMQDILHLGSRARMNVPGTAEGNWCWRLTERQLGRVNRDWLRFLGKRSA